MEISAASLEDALQKSKELSEDDFVTIRGEHMDGDFWISGVQEADDGLESPR